MTRIVAITMLILVLAIQAQARMSSLTEDDMGEMTGQVGITVDLTWQLLDSYLAWTDDDGFGTTLSQHTGVLTLESLSIDNGSGGAITVENLTLDVGTASGETYLLLGLPAISGRVTIGNFFVGTAPKQGGSLGRVYIGDLNFNNSEIRVTGH